MGMKPYLTHFFLMRNNQQVHMQVCIFIIISVAIYVFRPRIVAIFKEVFFEGILHRTLEKIHKYKTLRFRYNVCFWATCHCQLYKILSVAQFFYGEYMPPATMKHTQVFM